MNGFGEVFPVALLTPAQPNEDTSPPSCGPRQQFRQSDQIERGAREHKQPLDVRQAAELNLPNPGDRFQPPKRGLDARPGMLTHRVARVPRRARIDRTPTPPLEI